MKLSTRSTTWRKAEPIGRLYLDLVRDSSWNVRRVETIRLLDQNLIERRVSLDVDVDALARRIKVAKFKGVQTLPLPIFTQVKTLMLDLDIRSGDGSAVPLATSAQDSWVAFSMLLCVADENGKDPAKFSSALREAIYSCVRRLPEDSDLEAIDLIESSENVADYWRSQSSELFSSNADRKVWDELFSIPAFSALASDFTLKSMALAPIRLTGSRTEIVKYRYVDLGVDPEPGSAEAWGLDAFAYFVPADSIGFAQREHMRVVAPAGMEITSIQLWEKGALGADAVLPIWISAKRFLRRVSPERGVVYTRRLPKGNYALGVQMQPRVEELTAPALFSVGLSALLLGIFGTLQILYSFYADETAPEEALLGPIDADSLTTTLLLIPTLLSIFLVRPREHSLVGRLLLRLRVLVLITAFCMIVSASAVALGVQGFTLGVIFTVGFLASLSVLVVLSLGYYRARKRAIGVSLTGKRVVADNVLVSPFLPY